MSGSHCHLQPRSPDPNPLIIDHQHLSPLFKSTLQYPCTPRTGDGVPNPCCGGCPRARQRFTSRSFSGHQPINLPLPVPWPFLLLSRVRRLNVMFFCFRFLSLLRCSPRSSSWSSLRWPFSSLCLWDGYCSGHKPSGTLRAA